MDGVATPLFIFETVVTFFVLIVLVVTVVDDWIHRPEKRRGLFFCLTISAIICTLLFGFEARQCCTFV
ncbi:MAG: hypothetical protein KGI50_04855 [Patescibacteria group bacterium]|nr:hypothetical protein [Patescibacteria group bacterium]MDE2438633.1 hypothetical protein [Patescibacteria group bacterium]